MAGRRPLPRSVKIAKGLVANAIPPDDVLPEPPPFLVGAALDEWNRVSPLLSRFSLLARVDAVALAAYCQCYSIWREAVINLQLSGLSGVGSTGQQRENPLIGTIDKMLKQMLVYAKEFGFTPASRCKVSAPDGQEAGDDLDAFLEGDNAPTTNGDGGQAGGG